MVLRSPFRKPTRNPFRGIFDAASGTMNTSFAATVASWFTAANAPGRFDFFSDWATSGLLYQDLAGTTPVTALEQPVGLRLDRSRAGARGPELWTGTPTTINANWTDNGDGSFTSNGGTGLLGWAAGKTVIGRVYESTFRVVSRTAGNVSGPYDGAGANNTPSYTAPGTYTKRFVALVTGPLYVYGNAFAGTVDQISLREILGSHRIQPTTTKRPILSARVNWLQATDNFLQTSFWTADNLTVTGGQLAPDGTNTAVLLVPTAASAIDHRIRQVGAQAIPRNNAVIVKAAGLTWVKVRDASAFVNVNLTTGAIGASLNATNIQVTPEANGYWKVSFDTIIAGGNWYLYPSNQDTSGLDNTAFSGDGIAGILAWHPQSGSPGRYQRVNTATDYDAVGFPVGLRYDGVDDGMYTAAPIDYSGTDKVTVSYPVRKDGTARGAIVEHGASFSVVGSFGLFGPWNTDDYLAGASGATALAAIGSSATFPSPNSGTLTSTHDLNGATFAARATLRVNGAVFPAVSGTTGGGNFTSQVNYEGARADASLRFTGMIYGEFQIGMLLTADQLTYLEANFNALLLDQGPPANLLLAKAAAASAPTSVAAISQRAGPVYGLTGQGATPPWSYQRYWISGSGKDNGGGGTSNPRLNVAMFIYNFVRWTKVFGGGVTNNMSDGSQAEYWGASSEQGGNPAMIGVRTNSRYVAFPTQSFGDSVLIVDGAIVVPGVDYTTDNQNAYWDLGTSQLRNIIIVTGYNTWVSEVLLADGATVQPYDFTVDYPLTASFQGDSYMGHNSYTVNGMSLMDMMTRMVGGLAITACHRGGTGYRSDDGGGDTWFADSPIRVARVTEAAPTIVANCVAINDPWPGAAPTTTENMQEAIARTRAAAPGSIMVVMGPWAPKESDGTNPAGSYIAKMDTLAGIMRGTAGPWILLDNLRGSWKTSKGTQRATPRGAWQTGDGNMSAPTGIGNGDTWVAGDGVHPTTPVGITGLSQIWASEVRAALASM